MAISLSTVVAPQNLFAAWLKVKTNQGSPGVDGVDIGAYEQHLETRLRATARAVLAGRYVPDALMRVLLEQEGRKPRYLAIPTVRDRILQTAVALVLTPVLDSEFEHCSYGYRPGRSRLQAMEHITAMRDAGYRWVVDADISAYFDEVDQAAMLAVLAQHVQDAALRNLVRTWLRGTVRWPEGDYCITRGIPQGSPLSPLLANLYLDTLDETLLGQSLALVRYADDFVILCRDRDTAEDAMELTEDTLAKLSLRLNERKTRLTNFSEGFHFLGASFLHDKVHIPPTRIKTPMTKAPPARPVRSEAPDSAMANAFMRVLAEHTAKSTTAKVPAPNRRQNERQSAKPLPPKPARQTPRPKTEVDEFFPPSRDHEPTVEFDPLFRTLHLKTPGLYLSRDGGRLRIRRDSEDVESLPGHTLNQIVLHGHQAISTGVLEFAADEGIGVHFLRWDGAHYGMLHRDMANRVDLHRQQFAREADAAFLLATARAIVEGKIRNSRLVLRRFQRHRPGDKVATAIGWLGNHLEELPHAGDVAALRGYEGAAARTYYNALGALLDQNWNFNGRTRRPPMDPVNAMLSYGYGILLANVQGMISTQGLYPYLGVLHTAHHGQPALASDLMEEFRPLVVDSVVLRLALSGTARPNDFEIDRQGCDMNAHVKQALIVALEGKLNASLTHPGSGLRMDYRRAIRHQARHYASVVIGEEPAYRAMMPR